MKRIMDILAAVFGIAICTPLFIVVAVLIRLGSSGPVLYRGLRVGLNGRLFHILKFRTMVVNAEQLGGSNTSDNDQRITAIGRFLRKYKLDELPQLVNVLKGEMSFVGPRPEVECYVKLYTEEERAILSIRPGITDWASLWNSDEGAVLSRYEDPDKAYMEVIRPTKLRLQLEYVRNNNLLVDARIILATLFKILRKDRAAMELPEAININREGK